MFIIVTSTIGLRTGTLPRWLAFSGYAVALTLLFGVSLFRLSVLLFPAWVAAVSIVLLLTAPAATVSAPRERDDAEVVDGRPRLR